MIVSLTMLFVVAFVSVARLPIGKRSNTIYVGIFLLCSLYLFFEPPVSYDLYRHYLLLETSKNESLLSMLVNGISAPGISYTNYPVYMVILKVFSFFPKVVFPTAIGFGVYALLYSCVEKTLKNNRIYWIRVFCFVYLLCMVDFRNVSGIRNVFSVTLFFYALYKELVEKENKPLMWMIYIASCFIHSVCFVFLGLRLILVVYSNFSKVFIKAMILGSMVFIPYLVQIVPSFIANIPSLQYALNLFEVYSEHQQYNSIVVILRTVTYISVALLALYFKRYCLKGSKYQSFYNYSVLVLLFSFSSIYVYNLYDRLQMIVVPIGVVLLAAVLNELATPRAFCFGTVNKHKKLQIGLLTIIVCVSAMMVNFIASVKGPYTGMNEFFTF